MISKAQIFEKAIQDFGVDAALEYFDVPKEKRQLFKDIPFLKPDEQPSPPTRLREVIEEMEEELNQGTFISTERRKNVKSEL